MHRYHDTPIEILAIESTANMVKVKSDNKTGWISKHTLEEEELQGAIREHLKSKSDSPWVTKEVPQRVEQLYRQRRIAQMLEKIKAIKPEDRKVATTDGEPTTFFRTKTGTSLKPHESQVIVIEPTEKVNESMYMVEPTDSYNNAIGWELLDGSYQVSHGGYMVLRNTTEKTMTIAEHTVIGQGAEIAIEDLPFMDRDTIESFTTGKAEMSTKDKSRVAFRNSLKEMDTDLAKVLGKYEDMFTDPNPMEFETLNIESLKLPEKDDIPDSLPPPHRRIYSKEDEEAIETYVEAGLLSGFLKPIESEYTSPLLVVKKVGSDKRRCCLDARLINEKLLKPISYPMPTPTEIINRLARNTIYTTLDAKGAFNQIKLSERSQKLVAFSVFVGGIRGTYTTTSMPFGIRCAPQAYQKIIDGVTHKFKRPYSDADSYIDDLTLGSRSDGHRTAKEIHLEDLDKLLSRLWEAGFRLNLEKCEFLKEMVVYCGQEMSKGTYRPSEKHRETIKNLKPFSVKDNSKNALGRYLGVLGYHRRFGGQKYAYLEKQIRKTVEIYRKKEITHEEADEKILKLSSEIKEEILKTKLVVPTGLEELRLNTDASKYSWGAVLSIQDKGVVSYHGGTFTKPVIDNWSIFSKELAGLLNGLEYNKEFLMRAPKVEVCVDNLATVLSSTSTKPHTKTSDIVTIMRIQQLLSMCVGKITVKHCSGNSNLLADFCSRLIYSEIDRPVAHMASIMSVSEEPVKEDLYYIPSIGVLPLDIEKEEYEIAEYIELKQEHEAHHLSLEKTLKLLKERDRETNKKLVKRIIAECGTCCKIAKKLAPYSRLSLKPTPYKPGMEVSVDFLIVDRESSQGHKELLTTRCEFSRYVTGTPVKTRGMNTVIEALSNSFNVLGIRPETVAMDNEFNTDGVKNWAKRLGIKVHFRCSNNSRSIGVERAHEEIHRQWQKVMVGKNPRSWHLYIGDMLDPINKSVHGTTGVSPYKVIFGIPASKINNEIILDKSAESRKREQLYKLVRQRTIKSKMTYSKDHTWPMLDKGESIIVKYTNSRYEKERPGVVHEFSGADTPRVMVYFENNPPKIKILGIHKGHVWKRIEPLEPLINIQKVPEIVEKQVIELSNTDAKKQTTVTETIETGNELDVEVLRETPQLNISDTDTRKELVERDAGTEQIVAGEVVKNIMMGTRPKRTRKHPDRLTY